MQHGATHVEPYTVVNTQTMVSFITILREQYAGRQLVLLWDGASYHRSTELRLYLTTINKLPRGKPRGIDRPTQARVAHHEVACTHFFALVSPHSLEFGLPFRAAQPWK